MVYLVKQVHLKRIYAPKIAIQYLKLKFDEHKITHKVEFNRNWEIGCAWVW
nr:hypothetical protein [Mycoplasmopsis bovis]